MFNVLVADPLSDHGICKLLDAKDVKVTKKIGLSEEQLMAEIPAYHALLVRSQTQVSARVLEAGKNLKVVGRAGVGVDNIDVSFATQRGIVVLNAPDGNTISTAEHTLAMILALARNVPQAHLSLVNGEWKRDSFVGVELQDKTLGIIGMGRIGVEVAKRGHAFGMSVVGFDPFLTTERAKRIHVKKVDLTELLRLSDVITVHTPLMKETHHLINAEAFQKMKNGVRILNCARGGIIDEQALLDALDTGKVAGAALDVFENEPPTGHPLVAHPRVITTPHLGASTVEAQENVAHDVSEEVLHVLRDHTFKNAVNLPSIPAELQERIRPYQVLAEKLGRFVVQATDEAIERVTISYAGTLSDFDTSPLTRMIMSGVLSSFVTNVNYVNVLALAQERGLEIKEERSATSKAFTNLMTVRVHTPSEEHAVSGTVVNGFGERIVKIDDYSIDLQLASHLLYVRHQDRPGAIGRVGSILGDHNINIAAMQVGRRYVGGRAIMVLSIDKPAPPKVLESLNTLQEIQSVTEIDL